jgi:hypothetical protein
VAYFTAFLYLDKYKTRRRRRTCGIFGNPPNRTARNIFPGATTCVRPRAWKENHCQVRKLHQHPHRMHRPDAQVQLRCDQA